LIQTHCGWFFCVRFVRPVSRNSPTHHPPNFCTRMQEFGKEEIDLMKANGMMRELSAHELNDISGGFHLPISGGPVSPEPPVPPIIIIGPINKPTHGPIPSPYPSPIIGPFPVH
jgi:hypothetical protein